MNISGEASQGKEGVRFLSLFMLIGFCCFLTFYSGLVLKITTVYTHFFYIPIFLASIWWEKRGLAVVAFLSVLLLISYKVFSGIEISYFDYIRVAVFSFVGLFLALSLNRPLPVWRIQYHSILKSLKSFFVKETTRVVFITLLVVLSCFLTVYFHIVENRGTVFSHFFYIPIILSAIWWKRRGLIVAVLLACFLLFSHFFLRDYVVTINDYLRAVMFIVVPVCVSFLSEKISIAERKISSLDMAAGLVQNVNRLVIHEIDSRRLCEGIASIIAETPGCLHVQINLHDEDDGPESEIFKSNLPSDVSLADEEPFSYQLEFDGAVYGEISVFMPGDRNRIGSLLKSVSDELAYALYNLDIEKKKREAEERIRLDELRIETIEESCRELESFVHTVSHDLRSPLLSINLCVDMLNRSNADKMEGECLELINHIKKESFRMEELIKDILTLSRVGAECERAERIDIPELLGYISERFEYLFKEKPVEFITRVSVPAPLPSISGNRSQVIQVFENLLTNAVKFMGDQHEPCVVAGLDIVENNFCRFYVGDNGIGIAEDSYEKIFSEFYRIHDVNVDGTGIGLAIVKKIIDKHGGEVSVQSVKGEGSTFYFSLPVL